MRGGGVELWRGAHDERRMRRGRGRQGGGLLQGIGGGGERNLGLMLMAAVPATRAVHPKRTSRKQGDGRLEYEWR